MSIYSKCVRVINSCNTESQFNVANDYLDNAWAGNYISCRADIELREYLVKRLKSYLDSKHQLNEFDMYIGDNVDVKFLLAPNPSPDFVI